MCESRCWQRNSRFYKLSSSLEHDLDHRTVRNAGEHRPRIVSASSHAELNADPIAQELPLFARSARALGQT